MVGSTSGSLKFKRLELGYIISLLDICINDIVSNNATPIISKGMGMHKNIYNRPSFEIPVISLIYHKLPTITILCNSMDYVIISNMEGYAHEVEILSHYLNILEVRDKFLEFVSVMEDKVGFIVGDVFLLPMELYNIGKWVEPMETYIANL